jgi:hypothetical protein
MTARHFMNFHVSTGRYEIITDGKSGLLLPVGDKPARIYKRWRLLHDDNAALSDAYLDGVTDGIKYEMT